MLRRDFLRGVAGSLPLAALVRGEGVEEPTPAVVRPYEGPNVILVRFGGGVRRKETVASDETYAPFLKKVLAPRGVLFPRMEIASEPGLKTSHGEGTLNLLTGIYDRYEDVDKRFLGARFEAKVPTLFEALRKQYKVPTHQAIIINGEDRLDEEFYTFSNHLGFGLNYRSTTLSLYRYKLSVLREELAEGVVAEGSPEHQEKLEALWKLEDQDRRNEFRTVRQVKEKGKTVYVFDARKLGEDPAGSPELTQFWQRWKEYYGRSGLVNPRGDRLLTELATWSMKWLQPRMVMINYNDPDYVHWGNPSHYTRGIAMIDEGVKRLWETVEANPFYRGRTLFLIAPDCGRDSNPFMSVPFQHHNETSRSAHEIFLLAVGPGVDRGRVVDRVVEQNSVARTIAAAMGFTMPFAQGPALSEVFA